MGFNPFISVMMAQLQEIDRQRAEAAKHQQREPQLKDAEVLDVRDADEVPGLPAPEPRSP